MTRPHHDPAPFEPAVGEIRAVRTFRLGRGGRLLPLSGGAAWQDGSNTASCAVTAEDAPAHRAPDAGCTCGLYGYGSAMAAAQHRESRRALAVVSYWGRTVTGTRGIRAEHARIEALWLSPSVPVRTAAATAARYPSARRFADRAAMLAALTPTVLAGYDGSEPLVSQCRRTVDVLGLGLLSVVGVLGVLPDHVLVGNPVLAAVWFAALGAATVLAGWALAAGTAGRRTAVLLAVVALWLIAPAVGTAGWVLRALVVAAAVTASWQYRDVWRVPRFGHLHVRPVVGPRP